MKDAPLCRKKSWDLSLKLCVGIQKLPSVNLEQSGKRVTGEGTQSVADTRFFETIKTKTLSHDCLEDLMKLSS